MRPAMEIRYTSPWVLGVLLLLWAVVTGTLVYLGVTRSYDDYEFMTHAATTTGTLARKYYTISHDKHGESYTYHVAYNYTVGSVRGYCDQTVLPGTYRYLGSDRPVPLMYLPWDPSDVRVNLVLEERKIHINTVGICVIGSLFLLFGGWGLIAAFRTNALYQRLQREGQICRAMVTDVPFDLVGKGRVQKFYLKLLYRDMMGNELTGRSTYLPRDQEGLWREGNSIEMRYDRANPRRFSLDFTTRGN
jgi:hypothetical protein